MLTLLPFFALGALPCHHLQDAYASHHDGMEETCRTDDTGTEVVSNEEKDCKEASLLYQEVGYCEE